MVAQQPQPQTQAQHTTSAQDEALKRNTDCVYFLASPLTCKKGNECEYRHSEYARVNPRDCWYWLNGNCLNPKCSFRHPPLDGLLGTQAATAGGPSVPPTPHATTSATHAPYNSSKQAVPCIFFQKGLCLKGDRCAFLHGPIPNTGNKVVTQAPMTSQGTETPSFKKPFGSIEKTTQERKISQGNVVKSVGGSEAKPAQNVETAPQRDMVQLEKHVPPPPAGFEDEASRFKITSTPTATDGPTVARSNRLHQACMPDDQSFHNGKDSDEFLRESSPGFDVLVADELRNSDYYHGEDEFGNTRGQDERNLDSLNEYDLGHSADYSLAADIDRERFCVAQGYDSYDQMQDACIWEQHRKPSTHLERTHRRSDSPDNVEVSDLRHHLSKRRKVNGLKSVVAHDHALEGHGEAQSQQFFSRKDSLQLPLNDSSVSNRFRGRIRLPGNGGDDHFEREPDRGRIRGRLSSGRLHAPHLGRVPDRIRGRVQDDERRNFRDRSIGREQMGDRSSDFAGPKSLAELKYGKSTENKEQQSLGKRKSLRDHQQSEDDLQFEGPKPLSEILKEKRGVGVGAASQSGNSSDNKNREITSDTDHTAVTNRPNGALPETIEDVKNHSQINEEPSKLQVNDAVGRDIDNTAVTHGQSSEDGMIYDEAVEDQEYEGDDQRDGDYDYEQVDEGDYEYEQVDEAENPEQEYMDDEDGDDFAKKIGVMLT